MTFDLKCESFDDYLLTTDSLFDGIQYVFRFMNDYGASVVKFTGSYGYAADLWELAVIRFDGDGPHDYDITYDTKITDDVMGYMSDEAVLKTLAQIRDLA